MISVRWSDGISIERDDVKKKEKKKVIDEVTLPIVQKETGTETTSRDDFRAILSEGGVGEKQMCDYCDKMNMSPSVLQFVQNPKIHVIHAVKCCPQKVCDCRFSRNEWTFEKEERRTWKKTEDEDDRKALARQVALQATLAASMGILAGVSYHIISIGVWMNLRWKCIACNFWAARHSVAAFCVHFCESSQKK